MFSLHLDIDARGRAAFRVLAPRMAGAKPTPLSGAALVAAVRDVLWFKDDVEPDGATRLVPSLPNLLMFLSDVRGRRLKPGVFLGADALRAAAVFRAAAATVAAGLYLPTLEEETAKKGAPAVFHARWRPTRLPPEATDAAAFFARCVDGLARRAGRSALEDGSGQPTTPHDAWLAALRRDDDAVRWPDAEALRALVQALAAWRAPLAVSAADRAALCFRLRAPATADGAWHLEIAAIPATRLGLVALGQAAVLYPPLRALHGTVADLSRADAESFLRIGAQALTAAGFAVEMPPGVTGEHLAAEADLAPTPAAAKNPQAVLKPVATKLTIRVDGEAVTERELQFLLDQGTSLVFFRDRWIEVDRYVLREALRALQAAKGKNLGLAQAASFAFGAGRVGRLRIARVKAHGWLRGLLGELRGDQQFRELPPPKGLQGTLRDYQVRGMSWLAFLTKWGFGPCLADDMGLGKTIQTIAYILHMREQAKTTGAQPPPALVVAPVSVTTNWVREFRKFAPGLKVLLHQGTARAAGSSFLMACREADVVVTGYALLVRDYRDFAAARFSTLVLDEAQKVKNPDTRAARAVRGLEIPAKVALTGTPFENSAADIWSLEEILNPGLLGERKDFDETFTRTIREDAHNGAAARLRHILEPFMLRRLKTDPAVAAELGEKREVREYCALAPEQRRAYEDALATFREDASAGEPSHGRILALLTELKLICDGAGKFARLDELVAEIFAAGESCLIFTQYAKVGREIRAHLQETFGRLFPFLHGTLAPARRDAEIAAFNDDPEPTAFILSLKAGGFGLNLTRATHVIHFDRWWNPAVENQATDRAHRIGQTKTVFVHVFICAGTLEDHIDTLLESKRYLADEVVTGGEAFLSRMDAREFERIVDLEDGAAAPTEDDEEVDS